MTADGQLHRGMCPECTRSLRVRRGEFGRFIGCEGYPDCEFTEDLDCEAKAILDRPGGAL